MDSNGTSIVGGNNIIAYNNGVCFIGTTKITMGDMTIKKIKDIKRGDIILTDIKTGKTNKVARLTESLMSENFILIPQGLIKYSDEIICSCLHPFWINDDKNRILAKNIEGVEKVNLSDVFYNIQFEDEGTYYVEGVKVDSLSPNHRKNRLPYELYYDKTKYNVDIIILSESDPKNKKPAIITSIEVIE